jgi:hypothetical protein
VVAELRRTAEQAAPVAQSLSALRIDPLARLGARLDAAGETAIWRHDGRSVTHGASTRAWWAGVLDTARGRWTRQAQAPAAPPWLELVLPDARDGTAAATLWLVSGDAPALVLRTDGVVWRAPLPPSLPASWQQTVSAW